MCVLLAEPLRPKLTLAELNILKRQLGTNYHPYLRRFVVRSAFPLEGGSRKYLALALIKMLKAGLRLSGPIPL
jgi:hypothetical protein